RVFLTIRSLTNSHFPLPEDYLLSSLPALALFPPKLPISPKRALTSHKNILYASCAISLIALGIIALPSLGLKAPTFVSPLYARELAMLLRVIARSMHLLSVCAALTSFVSALSFLRRKMPRASVVPIVQALFLFGFALSTQEIVRFFCVSSLG